MAGTPSPLEAFGTRLRNLRKARGWSQEELARRTNRHWTYIGGLERGERNPTLIVISDLARALAVSPAALLEDRSDADAHPITTKLGASAVDILSAIEQGFRAQVDVKGKLAELFMCHVFQRLKTEGRIDGLAWRDVDGQPDFLVTYRGNDLRVECKNIRNETFKRPPSYKVELQRTRNSMDGTQTRGYKIDDFDVLGVSLFNQTRVWKFAYVATRHLERRPELRDFLVIMQRVPIEIQQPWTDDPIRAFDDALGRTP